MEDKLNNRIEELKSQFDIAEPNVGHFDRFEAKLNTANQDIKPTRNRLFYYIAVAASIVFFFGIWIGSSMQSKGMDLSEVSSEMEETQSYFVSIINNELQIVESKRNPINESIINDAINQIRKLESQYLTLTLELKESAEDKRIIYAMIANFQQRIEVLQNLLIQIENVQQLKHQKNETYV